MGQALLNVGPPTWLWRDLGGGQTRDLCPRCAREQGILRTREQGFARYKSRDLDYVLRTTGIRCTRCDQVEVAR